MTIQPAPSKALPVPLLASPTRGRDLRRLARDLVAWVPTARRRCDLDLLITGAMSPLTGFLGRADYEAVCDRMRLADGTLWPMPITLDGAPIFTDPSGEGAATAAPTRPPSG